VDRLGAAMDHVQLFVRQFLDSHLRAFRSRCYRAAVLLGDFPHAYRGFANQS
jgi:hypothetical protein